MNSFGRSLAFYLHYWDEMRALYTEERRDLLKGEADPDTLVRMIEGVGQQAHKQAASFLAACATAIQQALSDVAEARTSSREMSVAVDWQIRIRLQPKGRKGRGKNSGGWMAGVTIEQGKDGPAATCWLWGEGGRSTEQLIREALNLKSRTPAGDDWNAGTVVLGVISLPNNPQSADIDRDPVVDKVAQAFAAIPHPRYQQLFSQATS